MYYSDKFHPSCLFREPVFLLFSLDILKDMQTINGEHSSVQCQSGKTAELSVMTNEESPAHSRLTIIYKQSVRWQQRIPHSAFCINLLMMEDATLFFHFDSHNFTEITAYFLFANFFVRTNFYKICLTFL